MELDVYGILTDIAESGSVSNQHLYNLMAYFQQHQAGFVDQLERSYLKIIKNFVSMNKSQRKVFDQFTEKLFGHLVKEWSKGEARVEGQIISNVLKYFLELFATGLESQYFLTRICCGRQLFMILKCLNARLLNEILEEKHHKTACKLVDNTVGLFRMQQKQGKTQKGLAVKLGCYLQHIEGAKSSVENLRLEMIKTICEEEKKELRLDALTNIEVNEQVLPYLISRMRDVNPGVRLQVVKKMVKNGMDLAKLKLCDVYQIMHDGLKNMGEEVRKQSQVLVLQQLEMLREKKEEADIEEEPEPKRRLSSKQNLSDMKRFKNALHKLLGILQIDRTLIYPKLYETVVEVAKTIILHYRHPDHIALYLHDLLKYSMSASQRPTAEDLFFLKVLSVMVVNPGQRALLQPQLTQIMEHEFVDGVQLAELAGAIFRGSERILEVYETIQLTGTLLNCDEAGRVELVGCLEELLLRRRELQSPYPNVKSGQFTDLYERLSAEQIDQRTFAQHHFEQPVIRNYLDLVVPAVKAMKKLSTHGERQDFFGRVYAVFQEVRQPLGGEDGLSARRKRLEVKLSVQRESAGEMRREVRKKEQQGLASRQAEEMESHVRLLESEVREVEAAITEIDVHSLYLLEALLNQCDIALVSDESVTKIKNQIMGIATPYLSKNHEHHDAKFIAFKCLAYIPLFAENHDIVTIFVDILSAELYDSQDIITLISLKSLLDVMLCYDVDQADLVLTYALKSKGLLQLIAVEGLTKLLIHQKLPNPQLAIGSLLFLWFDASIDHIILQVITTFFKCYITSSLQLLANFQRGLEIYLCICAYLHNNPTLKLNTAYFHTDHWNPPTIQKKSVIGIKMIQQDDSLLIQERFISFICKMIFSFHNLFLKDTLMEVINNTSIASQVLQTVPYFLKEAIVFMEEQSLDCREEQSLLEQLQKETNQREIGWINDSFNEQRMLVNQLAKQMRDNELIVADEKQSRDRDVLREIENVVESKGSLAQVVDEEATSEEESVVSQPQRRRARKVETEEVSEEAGKKKRVQRRRK